MVPTPAFFSNGFSAYIELLRARNIKLIRGSSSLLAQTTTSMEDGVAIAHRSVLQIIELVLTIIVHIFV